MESEPPVDASLQPSKFAWVWRCFSIISNNNSKKPRAVPNAKTRRAIPVTDMSQALSLAQGVAPAISKILATLDKEGDGCVLVHRPGKADREWAQALFSALITKRVSCKTQEWDPAYGADYLAKQLGNTMKDDREGRVSAAISKNFRTSAIFWVEPVLKDTDVVTQLLKMPAGYEKYPKYEKHLEGIIVMNTFNEWNKYNIADKKRVLLIDSPSWYRQQADMPPLLCASDFLGQQESFAPRIIAVVGKKRPPLFNCDAEIPA